MAERRPADHGTLLPSSAAPATGEHVEPLASGTTWRIEQILSGQLPAPVADLLDHEEWVLVVSGRAELDVDGAVGTLEAGDWVRLGPGVPHRVLSTEPGTRWLAVHVDLPEDESAGEVPADTMNGDGPREDDDDAR